MKFRYNTRKGSGNYKFPESNPQAEFISAEENSEFRSSADGTRLFIHLSNLVENPVFNEIY